MGYLPGRHAATAGQGGPGPDPRHVGPVNHGDEPASDRMAQAWQRLRRWSPVDVHAFDESHLITDPTSLPECKRVFL